MTAKYTPQQIANFFIEVHTMNEIKLDCMKLLKLVYISYAWYLYYTNEKLFDESIQAWKDGPVVPSLYHEFKTPPMQDIKQYSINDRRMLLMIDSDDDETNKILTAVFTMYKDCKGKDLSKITHENIPWQNAMNKGYNIVLDDEDIKKAAEIGINKYFEKYENNSSNRKA